MQQEYTFQTRMEKQEEMTETRLAPVTQTKSEKQKTRITRHVVSPPFLQAPESWDPKQKELQHSVHIHHHKINICGTFWHLEHSFKSYPLTRSMQKTLCWSCNSFKKHAGRISQPETLLFIQL